MCYHLLSGKKPFCSTAGNDGITTGRDMKIIRAAGWGLLAASVPLWVPGLMADTLTLDALPGYYPGFGGGEFTAYASQNFLANYNQGAVVNGGFATFCLEIGVDFYPGTTYYDTVGTITQPTPINQSAGTGLPLSTGAAWLYYQFAAYGSSLAGFNYAPGGGRQADDNLLQLAIWAFQGGQNFYTYDGSPATVGNSFYEAAITALGGVTNAETAYTGGLVKVLKLWKNPDDTGPAQNQLVLTGIDSNPLVWSLPDSGLTVGLLGGTLVALQSWRGRRFD
jgi:hypothetical protein